MFIRYNRPVRRNKSGPTKKNISLSETSNTYDRPRYDIQQTVHHAHRHFNDALFYLSDAWNYSGVQQAIFLGIYVHSCIGRYFNGSDSLRTGTNVSRADAF